MERNEFIAIMTAAVMILAVLVPTNQPQTRNHNGMIATPRMALQFASGNRDVWSSPSNSSGGWLSSAIGGLFGGWAGRACAELFY